MSKPKMGFTGTKILLLSLSAYASYALMVFSTRNGLFELVSKSSSNNFLSRIAFTGVTSIDHRVDILATFFWPLVDGSLPGASLHCVWFAGQGIALWTLTVMEGLRRGNRWRSSSFTTVFGLLFQFVGMGIVGPIFLIVDLMTSPSRRPQAGDLDIDLHELQSLPYSITIGLIIPTFLMSLPAPTYLSEQQKANLVRLWQLFPILSNFTQFLLSRILRLTNPTTTNSSSRGKPLKSQMNAARRVYVFGIACSAIAHIAALSISLSAYLFPSLFSLKVVRFLQPGYVFVPTSPFSNAKVGSIGEGAHWFLQWDDIMMCSAYLLWACAINGNVVRGGRRGIINLLRFVAASLLVGPGGAAMLAMWEVEEDVHDRLTSSGKKKR